MLKFLPHMESKNIQDVLLQGFEAKDTAFINWETITKKGNTALKEAERKNLYERVREAYNNGYDFVVIVDEEHLNKTVKAEAIIDFIGPKYIVRVSATAKTNKEAEYIEIDDTQIGLNSENLLVTMQGKEGFAFSGEGEIGVVLDTKITTELAEEGILREVLSKVQNMRKDSGFEVLDRINLYVADNEKIEKVIKKFEDTIKHDTLANNIFYNETGKQYTDTNINGDNLKISVEVVK